MLDVAEKKFKEKINAGSVALSLQDAMHLKFKNDTFDVIFVAYGLRNMPNYEKFINQLYKILKPNGKLCIHDYSLKNKTWVKWYWNVLGYGFVVPFCTIASGSSVIFRYLIKSVAEF